jgi:hypothetical protein
MKVIRATVGRRDENDQLRVLNETELAAQPQPLINIALEAGFDMEPCAQDGTRPIDQMAGVKLSDWENVKIDWAKIESSCERGRIRFRKQVDAYLAELEKHIEPGANVIIAHTMAGGVPRAKIIMPLMNRVFKGVADRHLPSEKFWNSELGKVASLSFDEVTAGTFETLIEASAGLRARIEKSGGSVRYLAYGYHGTEVIINGEAQWQSYAPYLQGFAKLKLENAAKAAMAKGIQATVYNCPEILTNSSSIFVGVEVPLYPFLKSIAIERAKAQQNDRKRAAHQLEALTARCQSLLKGSELAPMFQICDRALSSAEIRAQSNYQSWPQHNAKAQMETLIQASDDLIDLHRDPKNLITFVLSEEIFKATGYVMFHDSWKVREPIYWLGHDVLAQALSALYERAQ